MSETIRRLAQERLIPDDLLNADELAHVLDVRPGTVKRWAREKIIPEIYISAKVRRFCYSDVLNALREHSAKVSAEGAANE